MADLEKIMADLGELSVLEAAELVTMLEEEWGVSADAQVAVAAGPGALPPPKKTLKRRLSLMLFSRTLAPRKSK